VQKHILVNQIAVETINLHNIVKNSFTLSKLFMKKLLSEVEKIILYSQRGDICRYNENGEGDINHIYRYLLNKNEAPVISRKS